MKDLLKKFLASNWKTSSVGIILSCTGYIAMFPDGFDNRLVNFSKYTSVGGLATLGICSKDLDR